MAPLQFSSIPTLLLEWNAAMSFKYSHITFGKNALDYFTIQNLSYCLLSSQPFNLNTLNGIAVERWRWVRTGVNWKRKNDITADAFVQWLSIFNAGNRGTMHSRYGSHRIVPRHWNCNILLIDYYFTLIRFTRSHFQ